MRILHLLSDPIKVPMLYRKRLTSGRVVSVVVADNGLELAPLVVELQKKIEPEDVEDGKLRSSIRTEVKQRGGKKLTTLTLSYESAEALHVVLGGALRDARRRDTWHRFTSWGMRILFASSRIEFSR